jgi:ubiquinone/menaquinone biosynthesis C-methylase UbiE
MTTLTHEEARQAYDRIGPWQDAQAFYEDRATRIVLRHGAFATARSVFEFGCGTGRFAVQLLSSHLPRTASYRGIDISPRMIALTRNRLSPFAARARVELSDGTAPTAEPTGAYDRFVSNYVLDLLSEADITAVIGEAHRMLEPTGLLCLTSLATGSGPFSRFAAQLWTRVHAISPGLVGGCRPVDLSRWLDDARWKVRHHARLVPYGIPCEVVIAERR